jgi:GH25 family lysozyme M1 (1,4-beta-N-acetylmuramidase)
MRIRALANLLFALVIATPASGLASEFSQPWNDVDAAIVLDPFAGNAIDWDKVATDRKVVAVIHKASQGLGRDAKYGSRRSEATRRGYLWGSYHLLTTADAGAQIGNYLAVTGNHPEETYAIDVECLDTSGACQSPAFKVSLAQVEAALREMKQRTGRLPLVYANHSVATALSARWSGKPEFRDVQLWYARFKATVSNFPRSPWTTYAIWQFSSEINCTPAACPYRVPGTARDMDLNVFHGTPKQLRAAWPLNK